VRPRSGCFLGEAVGQRDKLVPVDNNSLQEAFLGKIVHMDPAKYRALTKNRFVMA
jgi:hypothetical protein